MKELYLSENEIGDDGAKYLANVLDKVESIKLLSCGITTSGARYIFEAMKKLTTPVRIINKILLHKFILIEFISNKTNLLLCSFIN